MLFATGLRGAPKVDVNVTICGQPVLVGYAVAYPLIEGIDTIAFLPPMRDKEYLNTNWVQITI